MTKSNNKQLYKVISLLIKTTVFILTIWYIIQKLITTNVEIGFDNILPKLNSPYFIFALLLVTLNWGIEAFKWKFLIQKIEQTSFPLALKAILSGVAISIFTPNRVGEFAGRVFYLKSKNKMKATMISLLGSMFQLSVTIIIGSIAGIIYCYKNNILLTELLSKNSLIIAASITSIAVVSFIFIYLKQKSISNKLSEYLLLYNFNEMLYTFSLSLMRYLVFSFQYYLILLVFGIDVGIIDSFILIALTFFISSAIPSYALSEITVRSATSVYFFSTVSNDSLSIVAASITMWVINLAIPAIIGSRYIWKLNFFEE